MKLSSCLEHCEVGHKTKPITSAQFESEIVAGTITLKLIVSWFDFAQIYRRKGKELEILM